MLYSSPSLQARRCYQAAGRAAVSSAQGPSSQNSQGPSSQAAFRHCRRSTCSSPGHVLSLCSVSPCTNVLIQNWFLSCWGRAHCAHCMCVCVCVRRKQTRRRERGVPFYELTPRSNEYKWALICSTLHGWWRAVCDTSRPGSTDTKGANHYPLRAIYHRAGPTNLPVSAHDGCFATSNASALVHADR